MDKQMNDFWRFIEVAQYKGGIRKKMGMGKGGRQFQWEFAAPTAVERETRSLPSSPARPTYHLSSCLHQGMAPSAPAESSAQEIKGTKGMCWPGWRPCPLRGVNGFPAPTGSKSTSLHSKSTANEKQILWLWLQL